MKLRNLSSWKDVSINQYIQLYNLKQEDEIEAVLQQIGILYNLTSEEVENIPISQFQRIKSDMTFLGSEPETTQVKKELEVDGVKYHLRDFNNFTAGEWIDFESWNQDCINNLHNIMAVLYRKEGLNKYLPVEVDKAANLFRDKLDIETTLSAFFLFYLFGLNYIPSDTKGYSLFQKAEMEMKNLKKKQDQRGKPSAAKSRKTTKKSKQNYSG